MCKCLDQNHSKNPVIIGQDVLHLTSVRLHESIAEDRTLHDSKLKVREFEERRTPKRFSGIISVTTIQSDELSRARKANNSQHSNMADWSVHSCAEAMRTHCLAIFGPFVSKERNLTCQRVKSPLAKTQSAQQYPPGHILPIDKKRSRWAGKIHLVLT